MELVIAKYKEIRKLELISRKHSDEENKAREAIKVADIDNVHFLYMDNKNPVEIQAYESTQYRLKKIFKIVGYEITEKENLLETLPNKDEILKAAHDWCNKCKKIEKENK
jgi:hypothetical protein